MRHAKILSVFGLVPLITGCDGNCAPGSEGTSLEIGWGEERFEALDADEPRMEIIHGPQGGWHVPVALDASGLDGTDLMSSHMVGTVGGVVHGDTQPWVQMRCNPGTKTLQSWNNLLIWDVPPEELHGLTATIDVELSDLDGRTATDSVDVVLFDPLLE